MARAGILAIVSGMLLAIGAQGAPVSAASPSLARDVLERSGMTQAITALPDQIEAALTGSATYARLGEADRGVLRAAVRQAFDPQAMRAAVERDVAAGVGHAELKQVLAWMGSPAARRIAEAGRAFDAESAAGGVAPVLAPERERRLRRIDELRRDSAFLALVSRRVTETAIRVAVRETGESGQPSQAELLARLAAAGAETLARTRERVLAVHARAYAGLRDAELDACLEFLESEAARRYHGALFGSLDRVIGAALDTLREPLGAHMDKRAAAPAP